MVVTALGPGDEFLGAFGDPLDRAAEPACRPQHEHPFGREKVLHPATAADIRRSQLDAFERQVEHRLG